MTTEHVRWIDDLGLDDVPAVGGKIAALGETRRALAGSGAAVPEAFALTAGAYRAAMEAAGAWPKIREALSGVDTADVAALRSAAAQARSVVCAAAPPPAIEAAAREAWRRLAGPDADGAAIAVRSSATLEDAPDASFAGQHDSFLNIDGEDGFIDAVRRCWASLYTDRAIAYRRDRGLDQFDVAMAVCAMRMVRADRGASGVVFTVDTESGHPDMALVTAAYGLGEAVVQGVVDPDEFLVHKPSLRRGFRTVLSKRIGRKQLRVVHARPDERTAGPTALRRVSTADRARFAITEAQALALAEAAMAVEDHFAARRGAAACPMDVEWALDREDGALWILQARPETVVSRREPGRIRTVVLEGGGAVAVTGRAVGAGVATGRARLVRTHDDLALFQKGDILVADATTPDWEPVMKSAAAVVTNRGGRTCHAAIVARELGVPAVVGAGDATERIGDGETVTVSCAEGAVGRVYRGALPFRTEEIDVGALPEPPVPIMVNISSPDMALTASALPVAGVGLARIEFIIAETVRAHPMALLHPEHVKRPADRRGVRALIGEDGDGASYFVEHLSEGVGLIAAAFWPRPVIARLSDFKSNEYARLVGGGAFERFEENPMLGLRGAARYAHPDYREAFALECAAMRRVRDVLGLSNLRVMIPFCRSPIEADRVLALMAENGLRRGENGLEVWMMVELPANALRIEAFAERFDGFSIGSNDLTQLTLGVDRDSALVADAFDEGDPAVLALIRMAIEGARKAGRPIGICGQAPSDRPEFARALVEDGIDSISLSPDSVLGTIRALATPQPAATVPAPPDPATGSPGDPS